MLLVCVDIMTSGKPSGIFFLFKREMVYLFRSMESDIEVMLIFKGSLTSQHGQ